jgi:hypothetical protein
VSSKSAFAYLPEVGYRSRRRGQKSVAKALQASAKPQRRTP